MTVLQLPDEVARLLRQMADETGQAVDTIALDAILEVLEDWEDLKIVEERMKNDDGVRIPLSEIISEFASDPEANDDTVV